jgi:hypothetical protein
MANYSYDRRVASDIEYVIWGIPPGESEENVLHTKSRSMGEAKKILRILEEEHGCKKCRIQVLDLTARPDFSKIFNRHAGAMWNTDYITITVPTGKMFHQTDWDIRAFETALEKIADRATGTYVSGTQKSGKFEFVLEVPSERVSAVESMIQKLPEYKIPKQYGAEISDDRAP